MFLIDVTEVRPLAGRQLELTFWVEQVKKAQAWSIAHP